jgi:hypothetical protein
MQESEAWKSAGEPDALQTLRACLKVFRVFRVFRGFNRILPNPEPCATPQ